MKMGTICSEEQKRLWQN